MKTHILLTSLLLASASMMAKTITYTADTITNFPNPERGFYTHIEQVVKSSAKTNLTASKLSSLASEGQSLILRMYYLNNFRKTMLPDAVLDMITSDFALMRENGVKCVLRFAYSNDNDGSSYDDSNPTWWGKHLKQLKPILQANADVIAVVQAGFLGVWGEWYYSDQGVGDDIAQSVKTTLINQLLEAVPASRSVQLRTPLYKTQYIGSTKALTAEEAFTGTPKARLGHHNDAFLYQSDNMGTYTHREKDMAYLGQECLYLPNGGETDVYKESVYKAWATGDKAQAEMAQLHYSYLNSGYCALTLDHWRDDGSYKILERHMGYRFQLESSTIPDSVQIGKKLKVEISVNNVGYASPYNERHAYVVLSDNTHTYSLPLESDPRLWASGDTTVIREYLSLPAGIAEGKYPLYLHLPDASESIKDKPAYAIRFANVGTWKSSKGWNDLLTSVVVTTKEVSSVDNIPDHAAPAAVKQIQNGQLRILKDGHVYSAQGSLIQ